MKFIKFIWGVFFFVLTLKSEEKELKIGTLFDLSSNFKYAMPTIKTVFKNINEQKELNIKLTLKTKDDQFDPKVAKSKIEEFLKDDIDILLSPFGSYPLSGYLDYVKDKKILVFLPDATAPEYRKKEYTNIIFFLSSADKEGSTITKYALKQARLKKLLFIYNPEPFCLSALKASKEILNENKLKEKKDWITIEDPLNNFDIKETCKKIKDFDPDGIMFFIFPKNIKVILNELGEDYWTKKYIFGLASYPVSADTNFILAKNKNFVLTQLVPDLNDDIQIIQEYKKDLKTYGLTHNLYALKAYIHASIFIDICKKINDKITKEKIIEETEKIKNYDFKGFKLNFNPETRELASNIWIKVGNQDAILYKD